MREERTLCDVEGCKQIGRSFSFFKDRRPDGAGSCENWYYHFDLCPIHQENLLIKFFQTFEKSHESTLLKLTGDLKIQMREG